MAFKTEAIVLHQRPLRSADRMYDVLSPEYGRLQLVARGVAKTSSKMAGALEPFAHVFCMIGRGRSDHLAGVRTIERFPKLHDDWFNFVIASSLVELVLTMNVHGQNAYQEFSLLMKTFRQLSTLENRSEKSVVARIFMWKMLALAGWKPEIDVCAVSRNSFTDAEVWYDSQRGFVTVDYRTNESIPVSAELRAVLTTILSQNEIDATALGDIPSEVHAQWRLLTSRYYRDMVSYPLRSSKLFHYV